MILLITGRERVIYSQVCWHILVEFWLNLSHQTRWLEWVGNYFSANEDLWSLWKGNSLHTFTRHSILRILYIASYKALTLMILIFYQIDSMKQNKLILWNLFHISSCNKQIHRKPPGSNNHAIWLGRCFCLKTVRGNCSFLF